MTDKPAPPQSPGLREAIEEIVESISPLRADDLGQTRKRLVGALAAQSPVLPPSGVEGQLREATGALIRLAAECHRAKWQFDFNDENRLSVGMARDMVKRAFGELHRIGDLALKEKAALSLPQGVGEAVGQLQCLRCGTVNAFGPVSKEKK